MPRASLVAQMVKNLPAMQESWVQCLGPKDPLEKEMTTHFSILAWRIPWTEEPWGLQSTGLQRVGHDWVINIHCIKRWRNELIWNKKLVFCIPQWFYIMKGSRICHSYLLQNVPLWHIHYFQLKAIKIQ